MQVPRPAAQGTAPVADQLALAYAASEKGDYERALTALKPALDGHPRQPNLALLHARILLARFAKISAQIDF